MRKIKAFTLIELLVSVSIISGIMAIVLFNYRGFTDKLALSGATQELSIAIRQSQAYGINVKEATSGGGQFNYAYGIQMSSVSGLNNYYSIYVDSNNNNRYDSGSDTLVERVSIRNGVTVSSICDAAVCPVSGISIMSVNFLRPSPDARIYFANSSGTIISGPVATGRIQLTSPSGRNSYVIIENTGQIRIQ